MSENKSQVDEINDKFKDLNTKFLAMQNDMETVGREEEENNDKIVNESHIKCRQIKKTFQCLECQSRLFSIQQRRASPQKNN